MNIAQPTSLPPTDQKSLQELIHRVGWNERQAEGQVQSIQHFLMDPDSVVFFTREGERIAGFVTGQFYAWNRLGQIHGLVVDPDYRRQNLATRLVELVEQFLRQKGARGVYVDTPMNNEGGRRFYQSMGYQEGYIMPEYYDEGQDGITYQKFFR